MNWATVKTLWSNELRMLLRDRRTVLLSIVLPLAVMPLMLFGMKFMGEQRGKRLDDTVYQYTIAGGQADSVRAVIARGLSRAATLDSSLRFLKLEEVQTANPDSSLGAKAIHFYVVGRGGAESDSLAAIVERKKREERKSASPDDEADSLDTPVPARYPGVPTATVYFQGDRDASRNGHSKIQQLLIRERAAEREDALREAGLTLPPSDIVPVQSVDVATKEQVTGSYLGRFITALLLFLMMSGGSIAAMDSIAGEKERGSLETLLTTAVSRFEIIAAKQLTVLTVALVIVVIQVVNLLLYITLRLIPLPEYLAVDLPPILLLALLVLYIPTASVVSSILLMISAYAKSFKETQWYFMPVFLFVAMLAMAAVLPGLPLRSAIALVPIANVSVAVRDLLVGRYDWLMIGVTVLTMCGTAWLLLRASTRLLSVERLITASDTDEADLLGGPALFPRRVLIWFAGMWAVMLLLTTNVAVLMKFEGQYLFNMGVLFLVTPLLIAKTYRLDWKATFALRPVKPVVWALTVLLIPAAHLTAIAVFHGANLIFPVPQRMMEELAKMMLPPEYPFWLILFMLTVVPGIVEELTFRGLLLHGLHRRFHPIMVALIIGGVFGLFHMSLFRIIPTGFLGVILAGLTLATGSIFPGMLLHAGSNAVSILLFHYGIHTETLTYPYYAGGMIAFIGCLYLIYRYRTPYPGLRTRNPPVHRASPDANTGANDERR